MEKTAPPRVPELAPRAKAAWADEDSDDERMLSNARAKREAELIAATGKDSEGFEQVVKSKGKKAGRGGVDKPIVMPTVQPPVNPLIGIATAYSKVLELDDDDDDDDDDDHDDDGKGDGEKEKQNGSEKAKAPAAKPAPAPKPAAAPAAKKKEKEDIDALLKELSVSEGAAAQAGSDEEDDDDEEEQGETEAERLARELLRPNPPRRSLRPTARSSRWSERKPRRASEPRKLPQPRRRRRASRRTTPPTDSLVDGERVCERGSVARCSSGLAFFTTMWPRQQQQQRQHRRNHDTTGADTPPCAWAPWTWAA